MLDAIAALSLLAFFGLGLLYTHGCDRLKGNKQ